VLNPITLNRRGPRRGDPAGDHPRGCQVALLPEIGAKHPHIEVLPLDAAEPALQNADGGVDGYGLMGIGRRSRADGPGIGPVLPEEGPHPGPIPLRKAPSVTANQMLNDVLVAASTCGGTILDPAPGDRQETDPERRELPAP
jgi:hypothetical protein